MSDTIIVIDFETTGLRPEDACTWQVGAVAVRDGKLIGDWSSLIRPRLDAFQARHREVVRNVSGLDDAGLLALLDAPEFEAVRVEFIRWAWYVADCPENFALDLTAFNASFDRAFFEAEGWPTNRFGAPVEADWHPCLMARAAGAMRIWKGRVSLANACAHFGIENAQAHDGLSDARAAAELLVKLDALAVGV